MPTVRAAGLGFPPQCDPPLGAVLLSVFLPFGGYAEVVHGLPFPDAGAEQPCVALWRVRCR